MAGGGGEWGREEDKYDNYIFNQVIDLKKKEKDCKNIYKEIMGRKSSAINSIHYNSTNVLNSIKTTEKF